MIEQWRESILKFCPEARVCTIQPKTEVVPQDYHFYLINAINISKINRTAFDFIGFCIVDECHMIMSEILSQCMWSISPKYLLGLSATPYRIDGLNDMISSYFGPHRITRDIQRKHIIYKVNTGLTIEFTYNRFGKMDWNSLLAFQSTCFARNQIIINIVKQYPERYFLLLTKRIEQGKILSTLLEKENIHPGPQLNRALKLPPKLFNSSFIGLVSPTAIAFSLYSIIFTSPAVLSIGFKFGFSFTVCFSPLIKVLLFLRLPLK